MIQRGSSMASGIDVESDPQTQPSESDATDEMEQSYFSQ